MDGILEENLKVIKENIKDALKKSSSSHVDILVASKSQPIEKLHKAYKLGLRTFGENYLQELEEKKSSLPSSIKWHFIGHIQTNKLNKILKSVKLLHSVGSQKLVEKISLSQTPKPFLLQVNLSQEKTKEGILVSQIESFLEFIQKKENLLLKGLMTMPPFKEDSRPYFAKLKKLSEKHSSSLSPPHSLSTISMGTSHDYKIAIEEGATIIRLGEALLGERKKKK